MGKIYNNPMEHTFQEVNHPMKKTPTILLLCSLALLAIMLAGCGKEAQQSPAQEASQEPSSQPSPPVQNADQIGSGISDISQDEKELNSSDMNSMESDLAAIENM